MADALSIEVQGLRDVLGRFAAYADTGLQQQRDEVLRTVGQRVVDLLRDHAPVGDTTPHLRDLFALSPVHGDAASATLTIGNSKTVTSKAGTTYNLLDLITTGTAAHAIPNAFGWGESFGDWPDFHPGTRPNPFVADVLERFNPAPELQQVARQAAATLAGGAP